MNETNFLDDSDDRYADGKVELCEICHLPKTVVAYELGFQILKQQLSELKSQLQQALNKIDTLEHNGNISDTNK